MAGSKHRSCIWLGPAVALLCAALVAGCGGSGDAGQARGAAASFMSDLYEGHAAGACALETSATRVLEHRLGAPLGRYSTAVPGPCSLDMLAILGRGLFAGRPRVHSVSMSGRSATVRFAQQAVGSEARRPIRVEKVNGRWLVDLRPWFRGVTLQTMVNAVQDYSAGCLASWNEAVAQGTVTLPDMTGWNQSVWALLESGKAGSDPACVGMNVVDQAEGYCRSFIQQKPSAWLSVPCSGSLHRKALFRNVWLNNTGVATPASRAAPSGQVPAIAGVSQPTAGSRNGHTSTSPSPTAGGGTSGQAWIVSPSGNITCQLLAGGASSAGVHCQTTTPLNGVSMSSSGSLTCSGEQCVGNLGTNVPKTLPYGQSVSVGPFTCASKETGMQCSVSSGKGFLIARDGVTRIGPSAASSASTSVGSTRSQTCGTVTGGADDYQGAKLTVKVSGGVSCATAMRVMTDLSSGQAQDHKGASDAESWFIVDGWFCPYGNMGNQLCFRHRGRPTPEILASEPGAA